VAIQGQAVSGMAKTAWAIQRWQFNVNLIMPILSDMVTGSELLDPGGIFSFEVGLVDYIPHGLTYSEPFCCIHVVMPHVVFLDKKEQAVFYAEVMNCIVRNVIKEIAGQKSRKEGIDKSWAQKVIEHPVKQECQRNAYRRRHDESS
jgi:hypothetical protein